MHIGAMGIKEQKRRKKRFLNTKKKHKQKPKPKQKIQAFDQAAKIDLGPFSNGIRA